MKNIPGITFIQRTWMLLVAFLITNWACLTEIHFSILGKWRWDSEAGGIWAPATPLEFCGPLLWAVPFGIATYVLTLLSIHLHFRESIDKDINDGTFLAYWRSVDAELKLKLVFATIIGVFVGLCILLSPLARA